MNFIAQQDPDLWNWIAREEVRQQDGLEMIASENYVSPAIMQAAGTVLTNKYAEGYPGRRYYGGCEYRRRRREPSRGTGPVQLFGAEHANVQPHAGSRRRIMAAYLMSVLQPGDTIFGDGPGSRRASHARHEAQLLRQTVQRCAFPTACGRDNGSDRLRAGCAALAKEHQPKLIVAGASAYPREIDHPTVSPRSPPASARSLMVDMAHYAGLVAGGRAQQPGRRSPTS